MAQLLNMDADPLLALAGRIPDDLAELIHRHPVEIPKLIRTVAEWSADEVARLNANKESARG
jgi:plasmid maintenance system antidote protein VapI